MSLAAAWRRRFVVPFLHSDIAPIPARGSHCVDTIRSWAGNHAAVTLRRERSLVHRSRGRPHRLDRPLFGNYDRYGACTLPGTRVDVA